MQNSRKDILGALKFLFLSLFLLFFICSLPSVFAAGSVDDAVNQTLDEMQNASQVPSQDVEPVLIDRGPLADPVDASVKHVLPEHSTEVPLKVEPLPVREQESISEVLKSPGADAAPPPLFEPVKDDGNPKSMLNTLELRDMDINDVLKLLAQKGDLNIISGKTVVGRVTIFLQNIEVRDALTIILRANGLAYIENRGMLQIVTAAEYEQNFGRPFGALTQSRVIQLQSIGAVDAANLLNQVKSTVGKIVPDEQSGTVYIDEVAEKMPYLLNYIKMIDVPTETRVFKLQYSQAESLSAKIQEMVSPKVGKVKFDAISNKLFVKDSIKKLNEIEQIIKQIDVQRDTVVFDISYAKAEDIVKSIKPLLSQDIGRADADTRSNSVIVVDAVNKIAEIRKVIAALDKNEKEVLIEARIIQVNLDDQFKMGVDWEAMIPKYHNLTLDNKTNGFGLSSNVAPQSMISIGTLNRDNYTAVLQMINTMGKTRVLSSPRIAVVNNQEAKILIGTTKPYLTS
ncbi:MAG: secretin N-terminal domain-containing protein, partial [Candidatus Omnitrophota bacterium]